MAKKTSKTKFSEVRMLESVCREVQADGRIANVHRNKLSAVFGQRLEKALEALGERRVKKYVFQPSGRIVWIVVGKEREYLVMPAAEYCTCDDFYFQFHQGHLCYHIVAQKLAEATSQFDLIEDDDQLFDILIKEWKATEVRVSKKHESAAKEHNLNSHEHSE
jgi:predicted nucleic acid-binding Zn finger protein